MSTLKALAGRLFLSVRWENGPGRRIKTVLFTLNFPVSILYKSIAGRYRPVRVADGPTAARYRFIKNASWVPVI